MNFKRFKIHPTAGALIAVVALIVLAFWGGYSYGKSQIPSQFLIEGLSNQSLGQPGDVDFSLFWDAWRALERKFVDAGSLDKQEMVFGAIEGMVNALGDPYTTYFPPEEEKLFREDISGSFGGIGAEIGLRDDVLTIIAPLEGSPAKAAGLVAGDKILAIDGGTTQGMDVNEAVQLIRGDKGTQVTLTILREGEPRDFVVTRDIIEVPVIAWKEIDGVAHVELYSFSARSPEEFERVMKEISEKKIDRVILDLRNNPGGFLEAAQRIAGWFMNPGEVVAIERFGDSREDELYRAVGDGSFKDAKIVVLINGGSASASEIVAGALRDTNRTLLVGEKSFGKGSVQELETLKKGALKITIARWLTPNEVSISEQGLEPDIVVDVDETELDPEKDLQLERALQEVKAL